MATCPINKPRARAWGVSFFFAAYVFAQGVNAGPLDTLANKISKASSKLNRKEIAVIPFAYPDGKEGQDASVISDRLAAKIAGLKELAVVERVLLQKALNESKLQSGGVTSREDAKRLGSLLGVEAILAGTLIDLGDNKIEINARLINTVTGLVLDAESIQETRDWQKEPGSPAVLSNAGESSSSGGLGEDGITDSPAGFLNDIPFYPADGETPEFKEIRQEWESLSTRQSELTVSRFAEMKKIFHDLQKEKYSLLAQLYLAEAYLRIGQFDNAISEAKTVVKLEQYPKMKVQALYVTARSFEGLGKKNAALNIYHEIIQNYPFESRLVRASGYGIQNLIQK